MELKEIIEQIRGQLLKGQTEEALSSLGLYLNQQGSSVIDAYNKVIELTARFQQTKQSERGNLISFDDAKVSYSQINTALLELVKELESPETNSVLKKKKRPIWLFVLLGAAALAIGAYLLWPNHEESCPPFKPDTDFDILVLPFHPLEGMDVTPAHRLFEIGLNTLIDNFGLGGQANVESYRESIALAEDYPTGAQDAGAISRNCGSQLIIWGLSEKLKQNDQFILTTNYLFLDEESIQLDRQELGSDAEMSRSQVNMSFPNRGQQKDTIGSFSSISDNIPSQLESRLKFILGVFAHEKGNNVATQQLLEQWPEEPLDSQSTQLWGTLLADSYLKTNDEEKATDTYTKLIEKDPSNTLARNNRALLYYQKGDYAMAIQDLNVNLRNNQKDTLALTTRSYIFLKEDMLMQAEADLQRAKQLDPNLPIIKSWQAKIDRRRKEEEKRLQQADQKLKRNPQDVEALTNKAKASRNLGDYNNARKTAEKVIKLNPKSVEAYNILREADLMLNRNSKVIQRAASNGIRANQLKEYRLLMDTVPDEK